MVDKWRYLLQQEGEVIRKIITFIKFKLLQNFNFSILTLINFIMTHL